MNVEYVDHMGSDLSVVNAARVSFDKVSDWVEDCPCGQPGDNNCKQTCKFVLGRQDTRLIKHLAKHNHWTPFAHTAISLRMKAPVPIRTQCFKHKAGFVENEESRRYISSEPELFIPDYFRAKPNGNIKQGSGGVHYDSVGWLEYYERLCKDSIADYEAMIADGVCPEQARFILPQGAQVNWIWTGNLASYARFYGLRNDPDAQLEIQQLAQMVGDIIKPLFPVSWAALTTP